MKIHSIDTRGYFYWDVMDEYFSFFDLTSELVKTYNAMLHYTNENGINYPELRNMLVPQNDKHEICLIFDSEKIESSWYGLTVFHAYFPIISKYNKVCIFEGDLLGENENQKFIKSLLQEYATYVNSTNYIYSTQYFLVYVNNLPKTAFDDILNNLKVYDFFIGYLDCTYSNLLKDYISMRIGQKYFIYNKKVVVPIPDTEYGCHYNNFSYEINLDGFSIVNIPETSYNTFLRYKIPRNEYDFDKKDQNNSLKIIDSSPMDLNEYTIIIKPEKFEYLKQNKLRPLENMISKSLTMEEFKNIVNYFLNRNYLYNIEYMQEHEVLKFNLMLYINNDSDSKKFNLAVEYIKSTKELRVITFY